MGQKIPMAEHMLQGAALAEAIDASDGLIAVILLNDVWHFTSKFGAYSPDDRQDKYHDTAGGHVSMPFFPPRVSECVRLHLAAIRYLCVKDPAYFDQLSSVSVHTYPFKAVP